MLLLVFTVFAGILAQQKPTVKVTGKVINTKKEPVGHVSIVVTNAIDSSVTKGAVSFTTGNFIISLPEGIYFFQFSFAGYETVKKRIEISSTANSINLGEIVIAEKPKELTGVTVVAQKPLIEHKIDKSILNVENSILAAGNNALELLEQAPYVSVDQDGNITIKGNQGALVMIDGRQTFLSASDLAAFLRNTSSSQISKIEVITNPSAKYDASGSAGIINIKMKKNVNYGLNGVANISLQQGRMPRWMEGINLNYRKKKVNIFGSINHTRNKRWNEETSTTTFLNYSQPGTIFSIQENSFYYSNSVNIRAGFDYTISPKTTAGILLNYFTGKEDENSENTNNISNILLQKDSSLFTTHNGISNYSNYTINFNLKHNFDSAGRNICFDVDVAGFNDQSLPWYYTDFFNSTGVKINSQILNGKMKTGTNMVSAKSDYEHPLKKDAMFSAGIKTSTVKTDNGIAYFLNSNLDTKRSNNFIYTETINAFYADFSKEFRKFSIKVGIRGEQTISKGNQVTTDSSFARNYFQFFPTGYVQYRWNDRHTSGITLNRRIGRPDYESLNPFIYFSDPYTSWGGNPYLQPAITYSMNLTHIYKNKVTVFAGASRTNNMVSQFQKTDTLTNGIFSTNENLGTSTNLSMGISTNLHFAKWWRFNSNAVVFRNSSKGILGNVTANTSITSFRIFLNNNFKLSSKINAEMGFWYRPAALWGVSKTGPLGSFSIGVQKKILKNQGMLKLNVNDVFRMQKMKITADYSNIHSESLAISENRALRLSFSWDFGNKHVKSERERNSGLEDEGGRVKGRD